jgi:monoamine oxidase
LARTPLFDSLRHAIRLAAIAAREQPALPPIDELLDMSRSRRRFIRDASMGTAGLLIAGCSKPGQPAPQQATGTATPPAPAASPAPGGPRIVIVGGGMAGLNTAYKLRQAGLSAKIFEGSDRTGGRMRTATNLLGDGLTTELGGEFIDTNHEEMLALIQEFGLDRLDVRSRDAAGLKPESYFINGRHYSQAQAARAFVPLAKRIQADFDSMGDVIDYKTEGGGTPFDKASLSEYLDKIGASGWMRELLEVAYVTEYGLDAGEQSALNFVGLIGTGELKNHSELALLGESDERYKVRGGNQRVVDELAKRLESQIQRRHRLEAIRSKGNGFTLTFQADNRTFDEDADIVVLAIPFTLLREVKMDVELPELKKKPIRELGYGTNAKVLVGFKGRPWEKQGYSGATYSDELFQLSWSNSFLQKAAEGGITLYSGGALGLEAGKGTIEEAVARLLPGFERAYPGSTAARNAKQARMHWPTFPWTKASYACYKPGQWTTIAGAESLPVGNLFFAGEHCSYDFQGFMNGAAQSGKDTAKAVMAKVSRSSAAGQVLARTA